MTEQPTSPAKRNCDGQPSLAPATGSASTPELRKWSFEKAMACKDQNDIVTDIIYKAAEIEAYIIEGKNARQEFMCCVDAALNEIDHAAVNIFIPQRAIDVLAGDIMAGEPDAEIA